MTTPTPEVLRRAINPDTIDTTISRLDYPVAKNSDEIYELIDKNAEFILIGHTGSGKSTIGPLILLKHKIEKEMPGKIAITQPRQVATRTVAERVSSLIGNDIGGIVGYKFRGESKTSSDTVVEFQTDGLLLSEIRRDPLLSNYSYVMIDEAHERSLNIDIILGLLKRTNLLRKERGLPLLKVIIASATIDKEKFINFFNSHTQEGIKNDIEIEGKLHPIDVHFDASDTKHYASRASEVLEKSILNGDTGHILIFMPGKEAVNETINQVNLLLSSKHGLSENFEVYPLHAEISTADQKKIFASTTKRKIIVATNIAETSITIDGIGVVIDSGLVKQLEFEPESGVKSLKLIEHSKAGLKQRAGRAGRTRPGVCYRLFTEANFNKRPEHTLPEINRSDVTSIILFLKSLGINNVEDYSETNTEGFDYIDPPKMANIKSSLEELKSLNLIDGDGIITKIGQEVSQLPLEPRFGKMIVESKRFNCVAEVVTIASFLSNGKPIFRRDSNYNQINKRISFLGKNIFETYLKLFQEYSKIPYKDRYDWCLDRGVNFKDLEEIIKSRKSIISSLNFSNYHREINSEILESVYTSVCSAYIDKLSLFENGYYTLSKSIPVSSIFADKTGSTPEGLFVFTGANQVKDRRGRDIAFLNNVLNINYETLVKAAPERIKTNCSYRINSNIIEKVCIHSVNIADNDYQIHSTRELIENVDSEILKEILIKNFAETGYLSFNSILSEIKTKIARYINFSQDQVDFNLLSVSDYVDIIVEEYSKNPSSVNLQKILNQPMDYFREVVYSSNPLILDYIQRATEFENGSEVELSTGVKIKYKLTTTGSQNTPVYSVDLRENKFIDILKNYNEFQSKLSRYPIFVLINSGISYNNSYSLQTLNQALKIYLTDPAIDSYSGNANAEKFVKDIDIPEDLIPVQSENPPYNLEYFEYDTGILNPLTSETLKVYAIKFPIIDNYSNAFYRMDVRKSSTKEGIEFSINRLKQLNETYEKNVAFNLAQERYKKDALEFYEKISNIIEKYSSFSDLPGFNSNLLETLNFLKKSIKNNVLDHLANGISYKNLFSQDNWLVYFKGLNLTLEDIEKYVSFIDSHKKDSEDDLREYYLQEAEEYINKNLSRCPFHPEVDLSKDPYICRKDHRQDNSFSSRSTRAPRPSTGILKEIYVLGDGSSEKPRSISGLYTITEVISGNARRRGEVARVEVAPFYFDGNDYYSTKAPFLQAYLDPNAYILNPADSRSPVNVFMGPVFFSNITKEDA